MLCPAKHKSPSQSSINFYSGLSSSSNHDYHQHSTIITTALLPHQLIQFLTMESLFENSFYVPNCSQYEPLSPTEPLSPSTVKEERGETQTAEPEPPLSQLHNTNSQGRITKRRPAKPRSYDSSDLLLSALKCTVENHLRMTGYLPLSIDPEFKIDGKIRSWKEVEEWDMVKGERKTVKFSIDFKEAPDHARTCMQQVWHGTARQAGRTERHACMPLQQSSINLSSPQGCCLPPYFKFKSPPPPPPAPPPLLAPPPAPSSPQLYSLISSFFFFETQFPHTMANSRPTANNVPDCGRQQNPQTSVVKVERAETRTAVEPQPPVPSQLRGVRRRCILRRPGRKPFYQDHGEELLSLLESVIKRDLLMRENHVASYDGVKVDGKIRSWNERDEADRFKGNKKTVKFSIEFKAEVCLL
ncbi:hypothetical protein CP532_4747 [Ophiocordyceps camponoti-leonardi (nom. inval.)]|nr:hypothetical protein CP532_4747 [Ophiocordyceps camponoti-leonardi (nom. inval.)]